MCTTDDYFDWLVSKIDDGRAGEYQDMLYNLYTKEFKWTVKNDGNREDDGKALRSKYVDETMPFEPDRWIFAPFNDPDKCSVLEVLVALAFRMEDILYNPDEGCQVPRWFWVFIQNLGLDLMNDYDFDAEKMDKIVDIFVNRKYGKDGFGSLFPLRLLHFDQRKTEIWYQMMHFINENFE